MMAGLERKFSFLDKGDIVLLSDEKGFSVGGYMVAYDGKKIRLSKEDPANFWNSWLMYELGVRGDHVDFRAITVGDRSYNLKNFSDFICLYPERETFFDTVELPSYVGRFVSLSSGSVSLNVSGFLVDLWKDWNDTCFLKLSLDNVKLGGSERIYNLEFFDYFVPF